MAKSNSVESLLRSHFAAARTERISAARSAASAADRLAVRFWQQERLAITHAALLKSPKYSPATTFFLTELYSTEDLTQRDADIERVIKILVKFLPDRALRTLAAALEMDALSERMDGLMVRQLRTTQTTNSPLILTEASYGAAYRAMGQYDQRLQQIELTRDIGLALDKLSRMPLLRGLLRMMSGPAQVGGVGGLHTFLERGYAAFAHMDGAKEFINAIVEQERAEHMRLIQGNQTSNKASCGTAR
ncbi:MAG: hypothetical protein ABIZ64_17095 [Casimicrobium sp.]